MSEYDSLEPREKAVFLMEKGLPISEVSLRLGLNEDIIQTWRWEAEIGVIRKDWNFLKKEAINLFSEGVSIAVVARRFGITRSAVSSWRKKAKIPVKRGRPPSSIKKEEPKSFRGATCRVCQTYLDGNNSYSSMVSRSSYICKKCHKKQVRERKKYVHGKTSTLEKPPPVKTRPTPNLRLNAMQMVLDGLTDKEVAQKVGVNVRTVGKWKNKAGLTAKPGRKTSPLKEEALQMIREGVSGVEVARHLGVNVRTVGKWRKAAGLHGKRGRPPSSKKKEALQMLREGIKRAEVARRLGVHPPTVRKWQMKAGLSGKPSPRYALKEEGLQMIRDGITGVEVAKRLGVHKDTVRKWRKAAGLTGNSGQTPGGGTSPLKEEGLQMIRDGISGAEVARRLGVHRGTVSNWRKSADLSGVDGREYHSVEQENNVIDLLRDGKSQAEISRTTGIGAKKISAWKKQAEKEGFL